MSQTVKWRVKKGLRYTIEEVLFGTPINTWHQGHLSSGAFQRAYTQINKHKKRYSKKFRQIHMKIPVSESLF